MHPQAGDRLAVRNRQPVVGEREQARRAAVRLARGRSPRCLCGGDRQQRQTDQASDRKGRNADRQRIPQCGRSTTGATKHLVSPQSAVRVAQGYPDEFAALKRAAQKEFIGTLGVYGTFSEQLRRAMPRDAIWRDSTTVASR